MVARDLAIGNHNLTTRITSDQNGAAQRPALTIQRPGLGDQHGDFVAGFFHDLRLHEYNNIKRRFGIAL
jgi:hypothetical protein